MSSTQSLEIERKYLVSQLPDNLESLRCSSIMQGYLAIEDNGSEVRIRKTDEEYSLTAKSGGLLVRSECEIPLDYDQFQTFWVITEGKRIEKTRYKLPYLSHCIELDVYAADLDGLCVAEVEFPDDDSAVSFTPPNWLGQEVTNDKRYKNQQLAQNGMPL